MSLIYNPNLSNEMVKNGENRFQAEKLNQVILKTRKLSERLLNPEFSGIWNLLQIHGKRVLNKLRNSNGVKWEMEEYEENYGDTKELIYLIIYKKPNDEKYLLSIFC
jgi:hypothetical protein